MSARQATLICGLFILALCGAAWWLLRQEEAGPSAPRTYPRSRAVSNSALRNYVGDRSCATCHSALVQQHRATRHAFALRRISPGSLKLPEGEFGDGLTNATYSLRRAGGAYELTVTTSAGDQRRRLDFVFGSGSTGLTFVSQSGDQLEELRMSYFPARKQWVITPGQIAEAPGTGKALTKEKAQACFGCHSSIIEESQSVAREHFFGVGCESCHGPGRAHVESMKAGRGSLELPRLRETSAAGLNDACAQCHRAESDIDPVSHAELQLTQRFQPYGLMRSPCYKKSGQRLSCISCHDPHADAVRNEAHYERVCRDCHGADLPLRARDNARRRSRKVCPVNARAGCVGCHMPRREVTRGITMADHWIRILPASATPQRTDARTR